MTATIGKSRKIEKKTAAGAMKIAPASLREECIETELEKAVKASLSAYSRQPVPAWCCR